MTGHVFHPGHAELHGITVVLETHSARTYVGRFDTEDDAGVHLLDVGVHDVSPATGSSEEFVRRSAKFGVRPDHKHLVIPRADVMRIVRLGDISPS